MAFLPRETIMVLACSVEISRKELGGQKRDAEGGEGGEWGGGIPLPSRLYRKSWRAS